MRRNTLAFACLILLSTAAVQCQEHRHSESIKKPGPQLNLNVMRGKFVNFKSSAGEARGYLSLPDDNKMTHPGIIVIQEWWGLNDWIIQQTDRFAKQGYVALAVDLYRGKVATTQDEAHELMRGLPEDRGIADLKGGYDYLGSRGVDPGSIGVIGWCMGGGYALDFTVAEPRLAASVINYGHLMTDPNTIAKIKTPILGNFGADDRGIPPADVQAFATAVQAAGKPIDVKVYPGAGHAFMNPNNKGGYVPDAAKDAWARIDAFFANHLHG